ncbi:hypothetical protein JHD50_12760 [Sulfurimonas sp. MAG313]|nr:hypothetical protein [Sulfurimonas sp. MAG313]MDF1882158.1 hypothetical protein [Sulfurimonas sp. MAG313]
MNTMAKIYLSLAFLSTQVFANVNSCDVETNTNFQASYEISTPKGENQLKYYRMNNVSAFEYPNQGITEIWTKTQTDRAFLIRGFDRNKRGIEYEVIDLSMENQSSSWNKKKNIMNPDNFDFDNGVVDKSQGCSLLHYTKRTQDREINMIWNDEKEILVSLEVKDLGKVSYIYVLKELKNIDTKDNHITTVQAYDRTDFADIGDNESDPFFRKMINLGFISHHEANIIDAQGNSLSLAHSHH